MITWLNDIETHIKIKNCIKRTDLKTVIAWSKNDGYSAHCWISTCRTSVFTNVTRASIRRCLPRMFAFRTNRLLIGGFCLTWTLRMACHVEILMNLYPYNSASHFPIQNFWPPFKRCDHEAKFRLFSFSSNSTVSSWYRCLTSSFINDAVYICNQCFSR